MIELLDEASGDLDVRAVVLTATGKHFCTGADLRAVADRRTSPRPEGAPERALGDVARTIRAARSGSSPSILDCEKPVIAAVNGTAAGIGAHIALACDLVVAAESARFIEVFVRRGIVPDGGGAYLLPRHRRAAEGQGADVLRRRPVGRRRRAPRPGQQGRARRRAGGDGRDEWAERLADGPDQGDRR